MNPIRIINLEPHNNLYCYECSGDIVPLQDHSNTYYCKECGLVYKEYSKRHIHNTNNKTVHVLFRTYFNHEFMKNFIIHIAFHPETKEITYRILYKQDDGLKIYEDGNFDFLDLFTEENIASLCSINTDMPKKDNVQYFHLLITTANQENRISGDFTMIQQIPSLDSLFSCMFQVHNKLRLQYCSEENQQYFSSKT